MILTVLIFSMAMSQNPTETQVCKSLAKKYHARVEVRLWDDSRVDLLSQEYAIEADWAHRSLKWAEAIGQAQWYAIVTGRKPAVLLLVLNTRDPKTRRNLYRATAVCARLGVKLFIETVERPQE